MTASRADFLAGLPVRVDPAAIERELASLWKPASEERGGEGAAVRACLANLVVYLPESTRWAEADHVVTEISRQTPNRTLLLGRVGERCASDDDDASGANGGEAGGGRLRASITAACQRSAAGSAPVCCEQIRLVAPPGEEAMFPGAVAALLVPDIPVFLWWGGGADDPLLGDLAHLADRVIVNSGAELMGACPLRSVQAMLEEPDMAEIVDLGWRNLEPWRRVLAGVFDDPTLQSWLPAIERLEVEYWPGPARDADTDADTEAVGARRTETTTLLLLGWIVSRMALRSATARDAAEDVGTVSATRLARFLRPGGGELEARWRPYEKTAATALLAGEIVAVRFEGIHGSGPVRLEIQVDPSSPTAVRVHIETCEVCRLPRVLPLHRPPLGDVLRELLSRPPYPGVYGEALRAAVELAGARNSGRG